MKSQRSILNWLAFLIAFAIIFGSLSILSPVSAQGESMQLIALSPNVEPGQYSSYTLESSPAIGVSTNDIYVWIDMSGTTAPWGDFSRAVFYPTIKNNGSTNLTVYQYLRQK